MMSIALTMIVAIDNDKDTLPLAISLTLLAHGAVNPANAKLSCISFTHLKSKSVVPNVGPVSNVVLDNQESWPP